MRGPTERGHHMKATRARAVAAIATVALAAGLGVTQLTGTAQSTTYDATVLADTPVAFWDVNAATGTETDLTAHGHTGTYAGGQPATSTLPNGDPVAVFNGTTNYLTVLSAADLSIPTTGKLTWEAWIRPDTLQFPKSSTGYADFMGKCANYSPSCEWESRMYDATNSQNRCSRLSAYAFNPSAGLGAGADWQPGPCTVIQPGKWLHVVGEYDLSSTPTPCSATYPGALDIWVNGVKWNHSYHGDTGCMSQYSVKPVAGSSPFKVGTMAGDFWFQGAIGKVAIYNRLLTQAQITAHFTAMTGSTPSGSCADTCTMTYGGGAQPTTVAPTSTAAATTTVPVTTTAAPTTTAATTTTAAPTTVPATTTAAPTTTTTPPPSGAVTITVNVYSSWDTGYCVHGTVTNGTGAAITSWQGTFPAPEVGRIGTNVYDTVLSPTGVTLQPGATVTATNVSYNGSVPAGGTKTFGYCADRP